VLLTRTYNAWMAKEGFIPGESRILYGGTLFGDEERQAIESVLERNWWGLSTENQAFEKELAETLGVKHAVFANSGSSALDISIRALDLEPGSEVIVPACTFPTPVASIINNQLEPVVVDVEPGNYFLNPDILERSITDKTKAILVVYAAGAIGDLGRVLEIAQEHNLSVIEDNCDGLGGSWNGKPLGTFGEFSAISTHAAHIISTGEGGVVFTDNDKLAAVATAIRDWGRHLNYEQQNVDHSEFPPEYARYIYTSLGSNFKPLELQAAMGRVQLRRLPEFLEARERNFQVLNEKLFPFSDRLILPQSHPNARSCWYTYPITLRHGSRTEVLGALDRANIEWRPILAGNIARQPAYKSLVTCREATPFADKMIHDSFWVSLHPQHSVEVMEFVADTLINAIR
jgi:CDP-4-dehydro-6-deoxyglucose reductase, E1